MIKGKRVVSAVLAAALLTSLPLAAGASAADTSHPGVDELKYISELPNLFQFNDGTPLETVEEWEARREEIKDSLQYYEYGYIHDVDTLVPTRSGNTLTVNMTKSYDNPDDPEHPIVRSGSFSVTFTIPTEAQLGGKYEAPFPAFIGGSPLSGTNAQTNGYAYCGWPSVASDTAANRTGTYYNLFPYIQGDLDYDTGTLIAGAWGAARVVDALEWRDEQGNKLFPEIDETKLITYGFSRGAKTALLAAAFDDRIAMVWVGHSGQFGASTIRYTHDSKKYPAGNNANYSSYTADEMDPDSFYSGRTGARKEQMSQVQGDYGPWFTSRVKMFSNANKQQLPVDHHMNLALIAPRPMIVYEGMDDFWNGAESVATSVAAAKLAYQMYGAEDKLGLIISPKLQHASNDIERANFLAMAQREFRGIDPNFGGISPVYANTTIYPDFQYHPFDHIDPTAMPWSFPGQYSLGTVDTRMFIEGLAASIPVTSDADKVTLLDPDGRVVDTLSTVDGKATFHVDADDAVAGVYTLRTEGTDKEPREIPIECMTWEFTMRPEIGLETGDESWYMMWPERINNTGSDTPSLYYDTRSAQELAFDYKANLNATSPGTEGAVEVQNYGVMMRQFGTRHKTGLAYTWNPASGRVEQTRFTPPQTIFIDNLQFPDLFPGFTFDLTMDVPSTLNG